MVGRVTQCRVFIDFNRKGGIVKYLFNIISIIKIIKIQYHIREYIIKIAARNSSRMERCMVTSLLALPMGF